MGIEYFLVQELMPRVCVLGGPSLTVCVFISDDDVSAIYLFFVCLLVLHYCCKTMCSSRTFNIFSTVLYCMINTKLTCKICPSNVVNDDKPPRQASVLTQNIQYVARRGCDAIACLHREYIVLK